jgi:hypothetical protein
MDVSTKGSGSGTVSGKFSAPDLIGAAGTAQSPASAQPKPKHGAFGITSGLLDLVPAVLSLVTSAVMIDHSVTTVGGKRAYILFDDAAISLTYARNLAAGHGLVWSVGQHPVEGYSNFLWTLWMAAIFAVAHPSDQMVGLWVMVSGALLLAGNAYLITRLARRLGNGSTLVACLSGIAAALYFALASWTISGMETGLISLLYSGAVLCALRACDPQTPSRSGRIQLLGCGLLLGLAVLTRDDALIVAVIVVVFVYLRFNERLRGALFVAAPVAGLFLGHLIFRLDYYGLPVPNTYYLKIVGIPLTTRINRGALVLLQNATMQLVVPLLLAVAFFFLVHRSRRSLPTGSLLLVWILVAQSAYVVYAGGDSYETFFSDRFLTSVIPFLLVLSVLGSVELVHFVRTSERQGAVLLGAIGLLIVLAGLFVAAKPIDLYLLQQDGATHGSDITNWSLLLILVGVGFLLIAVVPKEFQRVPLAFAVTGIVAASILATNLIPWGIWSQYNLFNAPIDRLVSRYGLALRESTNPATTIAVVGAGNITLFDHRPSIDLLGYSDHFVATTKPHTIAPFQPGHDKWDYAYSIGKLRPDVVFGLFSPTPTDVANMTRWGYTTYSARFVGQIYYLKGHFDPSHFLEAFYGLAPYGKDHPFTEASTR